MPQFTAAMHHSRETLKKFTRVQYDTFESGRKAVLFLASAALVVFGVYETAASVLLSGVCLIAGCLLLTNLNTKADNVAAGVAEAMKGSYPVIAYQFTAHGFTDGPDRPEVPYAGLYRILCDEDYLYFFTSKASGYMVSASSVKGGSAEDLKALVSRQSGLEWKHPVNLMNFRLKDALQFIRKSKK